jgi:hypothetical protein
MSAKEVYRDSIVSLHPKSAINMNATKTDRCIGS